MSPWASEEIKEQTLTGEQDSRTTTTYRNEKISNP